MKKTILTIGILMGFLSHPPVSAQNEFKQKEKMAVLGFSTKGLNLDDEQANAIALTEVDKLNLYDVMDIADIDYLLKKQGEQPLDPKTCKSKLCLADLGKRIKADKILYGSVDLYGEMIVVNTKMLDIGTGLVEKNQSTEFLLLKNQLPLMMSLNLQKMFGLNIDQDLFTKLTKQNNYANALNTPQAEKINLSGPRFGFTYFSGNIGNVLTQKKSVGGFDAYPAMFQFGYQFEVQYLNQGNVQAVFEVIPMVSGLDQGLFIPSLSTLVGFRHASSGFEIAFGPTVTMSKTARGYYNAENIYVISDTLPRGATNLELRDRVDSRGIDKIQTGFVFGVGKSFKSGRMNIPLNFFAIPNREGWRFGLSAGFNLR